jgi:hypothetical protein
MSNLQAIAGRVEIERRAACITEVGAPEILRYGAVPVPYCLP